MHDTNEEFESARKVLRKIQTDLDNLLHDDEVLTRFEPSILTVLMKQLMVAHKHMVLAADKRDRIHVER